MWACGRVSGWAGERAALGYNMATEYFVFSTFHHLCKSVHGKMAGGRSRESRGRVNAADVRPAGWVNVRTLVSVGEYDWNYWGAERNSLVGEMHVEMWNASWAELRVGPVGEQNVEWSGRANKTVGVGGTTDGRVGQRTGGRTGSKQTTSTSGVLFPR